MGIYLYIPQTLFNWTTRRFRLDCCFMFFCSKHSSFCIESLIFQGHFCLRWIWPGVYRWHAFCWCVCLIVCLCAALLVSDVSWCTKFYETKTFDIQVSHRLGAGVLHHVCLQLLCILIFLLNQIKVEAVIVALAVYRWHAFGAQVLALLLSVILPL